MSIEITCNGCGEDLDSTRNDDCYCQSCYDKLEEENKKLQKEIDDLNDTVENKDNEIEALENEIKEKTERIQILEAQKGE